MQSKKLIMVLLDLNFKVTEGFEYFSRYFKLLLVLISYIKMSLDLLTVWKYEELVETSYY